ncbi:hypothetical protein D3C76_1085800 [compost metagenome]
MGREDLNAKARITLGELSGHRRQLAFVLVDIFAIDHQQRFFRSERIGTHFVTRLEAARRRAQATLISRDRTVGITGFFGADLGQLVPQFGGFGGVDGCVGRTDKR